MRGPGSWAWSRAPAWPKCSSAACSWATPRGTCAARWPPFPILRWPQRILDAYFIPGGKPANAPFRLTPLPRIDLSPESAALLVAANFCEVWLAREGHDHPVGINYLEKIQLVTLPSLYGALLAGVDTIIMGGGIPLAIPGVLDRLALGQPVSLRMQVDGETAEQSWEQTFDPSDLGAPLALRRPRFYAIVSSETVAKAVLRRSSGAGGWPGGRASLGGRAQRAAAPRPR